MFRRSSHQREGFARRVAGAPENSACWRPTITVSGETDDFLLMQLKTAVGKTDMAGVREDQHE
jgi:hypothetical protein